MLEHVAGNTFASKRSLSRAAGRQLRQFKSARRSANQAHESARSVRCGAGCGAPEADFGLWRTEGGFLWVSR